MLVEIYINFDIIISFIIIFSLCFKLSRQIKEAIRFRRIIKPNSKENKIMVRSNYIHITLYSAFIISFISNLLINIGIVNFRFDIGDTLKTITIILIVLFFISEYIIIPKLISNIK